VRDGTTARRIEPYVALSAGYEWWDRSPTVSGIPPYGERFDGTILKGAAGVNVPLGLVFVGAEGNVAKGWQDIDWEYGGALRLGIRPGGNGMIYARGGYQWVTFKRNVPDTSRAYHDWTFGLGFEIGPKNWSAGKLGGLRLRSEINSFGKFHSFQPTVGLVLAF